MSDIIIKGKNLNDINQSNFQTVGPRGTIYFPQVNTYSDFSNFFSQGGGGYESGNYSTPSYLVYYERPDGFFFEDGFLYGSAEEYSIENGLVASDGYFEGRTAVPEEVTFTSVEPWQGRINYDSRLNKDELIQGTTGSAYPMGTKYAHLFNNGSITQINVSSPYLGGINREVFASTGLRPSSYPEGWEDTYGDDGIYRPFFYNGDVFINNMLRKDANRDTPIKATLSNRLNYLYGKGTKNNFVYGLDISNEPFYKTEDNRFSLGTITENNKEYWETQTTDPKTRESQFGNPKMQIAVSAEVSPQETTPIEIVTSDEEFFSVDTFVYTQRASDDNPEELKTTPLFFYYDKKLHNERYNLATNGKVFMKIELRESGRDINNQMDNFKERKPFRPFLLGFDKDEQLQGTGEVEGEGLYNLGQQIMLKSLPSEDSYSSGIYDSDENLLTTNPQYILNMPDQDIQFLSRFRPNPLIQVVARYVDIDTNELVEGTENAKGLLKLGTISETGSFQTSSQLGNYVERNTYKPTDFGGEEYLIEQEEVTNNYVFSGFTFVSSSELLTELPLDVIGGTQVADNISSGQTFRLREDFHIPLLSISQDKADFFNRDPITPVLKIYANYSTQTFRYRNLNNFVDFENNFDDAMKYGPVKFYIYRGWDESVLDSTGNLDYQNDEIFAVSPNIAYQRQDEVVFPMWNGSDNDPRLTIAAFQAGVDVDNQSNTLRIPDGYTYGEFYLHQNDEEIPLVEPGAEPIPATFANAVNIINDGQSPPSGGTQQRSVGSRFGNNNVFILTDTYEDQQNSDEYYTEYVYEWGVDESVFEGLTDGGVDRYQQDIQLSYTTSDVNNHDRQSVRIFGSIDESTNLLDASEFNTPLLNQPVTHSFSHQPLQLGTYVKCKLSEGVETIFELTNVGPDEIVRERADSGVIDANMFGFGEEVRFQINPNESADPPLFNVFVWDDENSELKNINHADINLSKEAFGVTFEWNEGGNFGTLNYNVPESRDALNEFENKPIWFKYVEFRFTVPQLEDFTGEGSENESSEDFSYLVAVGYLSDGPNPSFSDGVGTSNNGTVTGPQFVVENEDDFPETFVVEGMPNDGFAIDHWEIIGPNSANASIIGSEFNNNVMIRVQGTGTTIVKAFWQTSDI